MPRQFNSKPDAAQAEAPGVPVRVAHERGKSSLQGYDPTDATG